MDLVSNEIITVLSYLLPGFVSAWIYYGITAYSKPSQFERIVQALIFTVIVQTIVLITQWLVSISNRHLFNIGNWTKNWTLAISLIFAFLIGLVFARFANNDKFHALLRKLSFTVQTSYPSEWFGVFSQNTTYVVLHLKDGRRIYGWPEEWPSQPNVGHFSISAAEWLLDCESASECKSEDECKSGRIPLDEVSKMLIPAKEVLFVEFMKLNNDIDSNKKEDENGTKSTAAVREDI